MRPLRRYAINLIIMECKCDRYRAVNLCNYPINLIIMECKLGSDPKMHHHWCLLI